MKRKKIVEILNESARDLDEDYNEYSDGWNDAVCFAVQLLSGKYDKPMAFRLPPYDDGLKKSTLKR